MQQTCACLGEDAVANTVVPDTVPDETVEVEPEDAELHGKRNQRTRPLGGDAQWHATNQLTLAGKDLPAHELGQHVRVHAQCGLAAHQQGMEQAPGPLHQLFAGVEELWQLHVVA